MTPAEQAAIAYLQRPQAIRDRTHQLFELCQADQLEHFACDLSKLDKVANYVVDTTQQLYPDFDVPFHSRWRHFGSRLAPTLVPTTQETIEGAIAKSQLDLAIISVLLDAGAGSQWQYQDFATDQILSRSEGLAVASLRAFERGFFSTDSQRLHQVDAVGLQSLTAADLAQAFQVSETNPLVGLGGRLTLLHQLGAALTAQPERFGANPARPGNLLDYLIRHYGQTLDAGSLLTEVLQSFSSIWPGRIALADTNLGDVWPHPAFPDQGPGSTLVPFHKLSQWLTYSLVEPLTAAGITVTNLDALTGLAEYRNGGLCVDLGLLVPKHPEVTRQTHLPGSTVVVEWRALTVVMLDKIGARVRQLLDKASDELPLIKVLEGGTWAAGRRIAQQRRSTGAPPIAIQSDGTVF
ncbi:uracil phosphoribosyltransferase [Leptolyngbya sp. Heron Island J]|uniref:URC4/urg3 family protein n=1 Tax=Leptolyngbya sp. Heron Island J TaxID=1385935 RepID=UPI0003B9A172|nr:URC4/urg3 family protein [Leptolyngbya sp. Heron Island J]ESA38794.1 uracil phosphoribosyltransferase [Leptolyngbya sp. Heron Island J]